MKKLSLKEIQDEEFKILEETVKVLDKNNLKYYLVYGTLLGAIRHKGFIPWDDDIDIAMTRPDYEKLLEISKNNPFPEGLVLSDYTLGTSRIPITKVINKNISVNSLSKEDRYLWIDIFVIDGLPTKDEDIIKKYKKGKFHQGLIYLKTNRFSDILKEKKSLKNRLLKVFLKPFAMIIPMEFSTKRTINLAKKDDFETSTNVGVYIWASSLGNKLLKKDLETCQVEFNGKKFTTFKNYKKYLKKVYGDYMKLPPVEMRKTHEVEAYRIGK